jgi:O-methyltransferase involved in polyketide biosynthesis
LVPIDFNTQEIHTQLIACGYSFDQCPFFVLEGVTQYLNRDGLDRILTFLSKAKSGSLVIFTYILSDFIDGSNRHHLDLMYQRTRVASQAWKLGFQPAAVSEILRAYDWKVIEDVGSTEYQEWYIDPAKRNLSAMEIERAVFATKL